MTQKEREELSNWRELFRFVMVAFLGVFSWSFIDLRMRGFTVWNFLGWCGVVILGVFSLMIWLKMENLIAGGRDET